MRWKWTNIDIIGTSIVVIILVGTFFLFTYQDADDSVERNNNNDYEERYVFHLYCGNSANWTEISNINFSKVKTELKNENITFIYFNNSKIMIDGKSFTLMYSAYKDNIERTNVRIHTNDTYQIGWISSTKLGHFLDGELSNEKKALKELTDIVLNACKINVDWSNTTWSYEYAD